jgi:hypothetical protein
MLISVQIGDFHNALGAISRLLDLRDKKPLDELPLEIIASELLGQSEQNDDSETENAKNSPETTEKELKDKLKTILARVNSKQTLGYKVRLF